MSVDSSGEQDRMAARPCSNANRDSSFVVDSPVLIKPEITFGSSMGAYVLSRKLRLEVHKATLLYRLIGMGGYLSTFPAKDIAV